MCVPLPNAARVRYFYTATDDDVSCCCYGGDDCDRPRRSAVHHRRGRLTADSYAATKPSSRAAPDGEPPQQDACRRCRRHHCRFAPYPPSKPAESPADTGPMFKQGFPPGMGLMADPAADQTASSVPLPPPPPSAPASSTGFNLQFNHQVPTGFSSFASEHHNYYNHQFPYTFLSASPPTYSWANTNSTDIMKFTGSSNPRPLDTSSYHISNFGSVPKRKIDLEAELPQPPKMRITEEKVSASLRDMHISNTFKPHNYCANTNVSDMDIIEDPSPSNVITANDVSKTESKTTLIMCEELRKLNKIDSIIPQPLLNVERPTNAVVVWKPKPVIELVRSFTDYEEPKSSVVITEITDEEEEELNNDEEMFVEDDNTIAVEDDDMEL